MHCPHCGSTEAKQDVKETRHTTDGRIIRRRRCEDCRHDYKTIEQLSDVGLRVQKSDGRLVAFSRESIRQSIVQAAVRKYDHAEVDQLIDAVIGDVYGKADDGVVASSVIGESVLSHFREMDEVSQIRFALVHLGRLDRSDGQPGWKNVEDVRRWLANEHPELKGHHTPAMVAQVYKRNREHEEFDRTKIERSIKIAAKGRGASDDVDKLAYAVASEVEDALGDQPIVTSGQITAEILRTLRAKDHIAYLRFASTAKRFRVPGDYQDEVVVIRSRPRAK
jgi:transcriptional repressor NrdR